MNPLRPLTADRRSARPALVLTSILLLAGVAAPTRAGDAPKEPPGPDSSTPSGRRSVSPAAVAAWEKAGLPHYQPPESYSEDLVINAQGKSYVLKRSLDRGKTRTEFSADGHDMIMIELGDAQGTTYQLMPDRKEAVKQSRQSMEEMAGGAAKKAEAEAKKEAEKAQATQDNAPPMDVKVEDLGDDAVDGQPAKKLRLTSADGALLAWFEKATGAPLRMESTVNGQNAVVEWKNRKLAPQAASLFEVPKDYKLHDIDEMVAQMKPMGGMGGMAHGMLSGMTQGMGSNLGASLGTSLGGSLGGPLGAMAGQYIGGRIGGLLGKKAADAIH